MKIIMGNEKKVMKKERVVDNRTSSIAEGLALKGYNN
jgi:hypothetical protein